MKNKYLVILVLSLGLFWGSQAKAAESPIASTKATEALVDAFSFQSDGTLDMTVTGSMTGVDLTLTGDLTTSLTANSVPFIGASGILTEDTTGLIYDGTAMAIGTSTSNATGLHIYVGAAGGGVTANSNSDDFVVESSGSGGATFLAPDMNDVSLVMGSASDSIGFKINWNYGADLLKISTRKIGASMKFETGDAAEAMRIDSGQDLLFGTTISVAANGGKVMVYGNNGAVPTMGAGTAGLFGSDTATVIELYAIDSDSNETQLTGNTEAYPGDMAVSVNYPYVNPRTQHYVGIKTYISEHRALELLQDLLRSQGMLQTNEFIIKHINFVPSINWEDNQEFQRLRREQEIQDTQDRLVAIDLEIPLIISDYDNMITMKKDEYDNLIAIEIEPEKILELQKAKLSMIAKLETKKSERIKGLQDAKANTKIPSPYVKRNPGSQWLISKGVKLK